MKEFLILLAAATAGGLCNGLLGAGGGIIVAYALSRGTDGILEDKRDVFANALCVMLPVSVFAYLRYMSKGVVPDITDAGYLIIAATAGGAVGGLLLGKLRLSLLRRVFALIVIWSGLSMLFG